MDKPSQNNLYAGLIIYRTQRKNNTEYLLLNDTFTNKKHWFCSKGQVIGNEDTIKETFEVTGLRPNELRIEEGFAIELRYLSGTRAKKVKYHLAQLIDHHTRLLSNAEGIHMQWFNQATVSDKVIFKSMQDALRHAQTFIEAKHLRPQRKRQPDLYKNAESQVEQRQQVEQQQRNPTQQMSAESNPLYKTRLCERFETEGSCPYGPKCNFAHGIDELRGKTEPRFEKEEVTTDGNQLFKTKLCEKFMRERFCQYGPKCHFAHGEVELKERPMKAVEQRCDESSDIDNEMHYGNNNRHNKYNEPSRPSENNWRNNQPVIGDRDTHWRSRVDHSQVAGDREGQRKNKFDANREGSWRNRMGSPAPTDSISSATEKFNQLNSSLSDEDTQSLNWKTAGPMGKDDGNIALKPTVEELKRPKLTEQQCRTPKPNKKIASASLASDEKSWMKIVKLSREEQEELESDSAAKGNIASAGNTTMNFSNGTSQRKAASPNKTAQIEAIISDLKKFFLKPVTTINTKGTLMEDVKEVTRIEMRNDLSKSQLFYILLVCLLEDVSETSNILSILKSRDHLFKTFVKNGADQLLLLKAWEQFVNQRKPVMINKTVIALSHWYDCEMIDDEVFIRWYNTLGKGNSLERKSEKFIEWLNEEDEED
ncbi:unnamed protein product [Rhizopus stolonifer]